MNLRGFVFTTSVSAFGYFIIFNRIERNEFDTFILLAFINFLISLYLIHQYKNHSSLLLLSTLVFHGIALFSIPNLSDDYYRFLWDGHLQSVGESPFALTPKQVMQSDLNDPYFTELFTHINSPNYYSVYPPLNQWLFRISAMADNPSGGLFILKIIILFGNTLLFIALFLLQKALRYPTQIIYLILLNPLLILETSGNLHFESMTVALFLMAIYFFHHKKNIYAGIFAALAVSLKLLPLILIPILLKKTSRNLIAKFVFAFLITGCVLLLPYFDLHAFANIADSINLYFQSFEFNASLYYLTNALVSSIAGFNTISYVGPACMLLFLVFYSILFIQKKKHLDLFNSIYFVLLFYFICATTIHPWYIISVMIFGVISQRISALVFSLVVLLSYSHYSNASDLINTLLIVIEYSILLLTLVFEQKIKEKLNLF